MTSRRYLTTAELVELAGKTPDFWARLCKAGTLPAVKLGNDWRVSATAFDRFMNGPARSVEPPRRLTARQRRRQPVNQHELRPSSRC